MRLVDDAYQWTWRQRVMGHERSSTTLDLDTRRTDDHGRILRVLDDDDLCWRLAVITHMKID
jgi:hypothetical protein